MKRVFPWLALVLLIGVSAGAPWLFGRMAEEHFAQAVTDLDALSERVSLEPISYERGYLSAHARTAVTLRGSEREPGSQDQQLILETRVEHGLTGVKSVTRPDRDSLTYAGLLFDDRLPDLRVDAGVDGALRSRLRMPAFAWEPDIEVPLLAGSSGEMAPLRMKLEFQRGGRYSLDLNWPGGAVDVGHSRLIVEEVSLVQKLEPLLDRLWQGEGSARIGRFELQPLLDDPVVMEDWHLDNESRLNGDYLDASLSTALESFVLGGESLGEQRFEASIDRFHASSLDGVLDALLDLRALQAERDRANAPEEMALYRRLSDHLQQLSVHGGDLRIPDLKLRFPEGRVLGSLHLNYPQLPANQRDEQVSLLTHANGEASLVIDRNMLWLMPAQARSGLMRLYRHGLLDESRGEYLLDVRLEGMEMDVNGELIALPPLL